MSKSEILEQLPNLARSERREIMERIWEMEEKDLLNGAEPDIEEKSLLDAEMEEFQSNPTAGADWTEVGPRLRKQIRS